MAFKLFRLAVGLVLAAAGIWLIAGGVESIVQSLSRQVGAGALVSPILQVVAGLGVFAAYYYFLWSASRIRQVMENIFAIPELIRKIAFTIGLLCIYRIGFYVPLPGLNQEALAEWAKTLGGGMYGQAMAIAGMLTGGNLSQSTLFGLGIMPYISASIIMQLLGTVVPSLAKLQKEGPAGYKKIQEYTRYGTVLLCVIQAIVWMRIMVSPGSGTNESLVYPQYIGSYSILIMGVIGLTAGTIFLMWLGEQIDEYGIGSGISLLIMAGILARLPKAIEMLISQADLSLTGAAAGKIDLMRLLFLIFSFVFVVAGAILITQAQRRIPVQQAKHARGRRVYGGQRQHLPLRVNHGGVMPIIFASSLMIFPGIILKSIAQKWPQSGVLQVLASAFESHSYVYAVVETALIFFFAYFWTTVQFKPKEMAEQLRDYGSFIPGMRPGKRTAEYLEKVMERITYCGAAFLAVIAVIPMTFAAVLGIDYQIAAFLGGTGLLIMVSVALDLVQRIEAQLVMRNYGGFLGGSTRIKGAYS